MTSEAHDSIVENMNVVAAASGEDNSHLLLVKAQFQAEKPVPEFDDAELHRFKHDRIGKRLAAWQMIRVEVENQVCAEPAFFLHRRGARFLIIREIGRASGRERVETEEGEEA